MVLGGWLIGAVVVGLAAHLLLYRGLSKLSERTAPDSALQRSMLQHSRPPARLLFPLLALYVTLPFVQPNIAPNVLGIAEDVLYLLLVMALAWLLIKLTAVLEEEITRRFDVNVADNLQARKVHTQVKIIRRILIIVIGVVALAAALLPHEGFRALGTGILASAGIVGIIIGLAAQRTIGNLLAGFQIAITQPIRVDDVVIVEDEWGWIEEITLTYVVVRIWDLRRLVLPISYFIETPFENWTRTSADLLGTAFFYVDHTVPVGDVREELQRIVEQSEYWDGNVCRLHVTNVSERTVELRALVSAATAPHAFELRCEVRERMIDYLQKTYPNSLPKVRTRIENTTALGPRAEDINS